MMRDAVPSAFAPREELRPDAVYTSAEVARLVFRCSIAWWYQNRKRLTSAEGFPRPITKTGRPRWSGFDLIHWLARDKTAELTGPNITKFSDALLKKRATTLAKKRTRA